MLKKVASGALQSAVHHSKAYVRRWYYSTGDPVPLFYLAIVSYVLYVERSYERIYGYVYYVPLSTVILTQVLRDLPYVTCQGVGLPSMDGALDRTKSSTAFYIHPKP